MYKMNTVFMDSENSEMPKLHILVLKLTNKLDFRTGERLSHYQILVFITHRET